MSKAAVPRRHSFLRSCCTVRSTVYTGVRSRCQEIYFGVDLIRGVGTRPGIGENARRTDLIPEREAACLYRRWFAVAVHAMLALW